MTVRQQTNLLVSLEGRVKSRHLYRRLETRLDFDGLCRPLARLYPNTARQALGVTRGFKVSVLQFKYSWAIQ